MILNIATKLKRMVDRLIKRKLLDHYKKLGLTIADDCLLNQLPSFGPEPFLISIGKRVAISSKVTFITHDGATYVFRDQPKYQNIRRFGRITIHDNCFIGYGATILPGVTIGPDAVVGAHAVVVSDVPPGMVVWGVPARPLMSLEKYAEKSLAQSLPCDEAAYARDRRAELVRLLPPPW